MSNTKLTSALSKRLTTTLTRTGIIAGLITCMIAINATESFAVSRAAALYLRLAAGARAAGMGEAYVAVADDATATHWNPAGLGAPPLSATWKETSVPARFRPITKYGIAKRGGGSGDFAGYQIWAISAKGLVSFNGSEWLTGKDYETSPDEELSSIVRRYLQISDEKLVNDAMTKIANLNNEKSAADLQLFADRVMAALPESVDATVREDIANRLVTLQKKYDLLLVNWRRVNETESRFMKDKEDGSLSEQDFDRLSVGLERSVRRFLPETISLPYSLDFDGELTDLVTIGKTVWVGTTTGLHKYDGRRWSAVRMTAPEEGKKSPLPSNNVTCLTTDGKRLFVGTDKGLVEHFGISWEIVGAESGLPQGSVSAVTYSSVAEAWVVVDGDIFHLKDKSWKNYVDFTVAIDETPEAIAKNFAIYNTDAEKTAYLTKLSNLAKLDTTTAEAVASAPIGVAPEKIGAGELTLNLGDVIRAPIIAGIKGEVTSLEASGSFLFVGTAEGLMIFNGKGWERPGYRSYDVSASTTVTAIALDVAKGDSAAALMVASKIREHNDLDGENVEGGQTIWVYRNEAGSRINDIRNVDGFVYVATERGALVADGAALSRFSEAGLNRTSTVTVSGADGALWFGSANKLKFIGQPRRHLSLMYAKWLPELTDDLSYQFASYVQSIKGAGTFGISLSLFDYGSVQRTDANGNPIGTDSPVDLALALSYGMPISAKTSWGATVKLLYSDLSGLGAGDEQGTGRATGFAVDAGLMHRMSDRLNLGVAITNIGPKLAYIDRQQADPLPTNLAVGFAGVPWRNDLLELMFVGDANYVVVEDKFEPVFNGGLELVYADFIAFRFGRQHDDAGEIKTWTFGFGLSLNVPGVGEMPIDLAYIPSNDDLALANTLRTSVSFQF